MAAPSLSLLSVKQRLILLGVTTTISLAILISVNNIITSREERLDKNSIAITQINADILKLQQREKAFLTLYNIENVTAFNNTLEEALSKTEILEQGMREQRLDNSSANIILNDLHKYAEMFGTIVTLQKEIGLNPTDGLYGTLREAVHDVEKKLATQNDYKLLVNMLQLRRNEKDFMLRHDMKYVDEFSNNIKKFITNVENSSHSRGDKDALNTLIVRYSNDFLKLAKAEQKIGLTPDKGMRGTLQKIVNELNVNISQAEEIIYKEVSRISTSMDMTALTTSTILAVLNLSLIFWISRSISKPVAELSDAMSHAHQERDLTLQVAADGQDELARMGRVFNEMLDNLGNIMHQIRDASDHLGTAASKLSDITDQTNHSMVKQRTESDMVATAMNQMSSTVLEVARNANAAADASRLADEHANRGSSVVNTAIGGINTLAEQVRRTAIDIKELEQESHNISTVLNVIREIADQTNLLALNAAIEAARAGEQGRGFAVVADEVRSLAQRSQQSTEEINEIITRLQQKSLSAARSMEAGLAQTQASVAQAEAAGHALSEITTAVTAINDMNIQIASAAEEQSAVTEEINRNIINITQIAAETADGTDHIIQTSHSLAQMAEELGRMVGQFKTH